MNWLEMDDEARRLVMEENRIELENEVRAEIAFWNRMNQEGKA